MIISKVKHLFLLLSLILNYSISSLAQPNNSADRFCGKKMIGYVAKWNGTPIVDYKNMTHAFFSFLKPTTKGGLWKFSATEERALFHFLRDTPKNNCKRFISLSDGGDGVFSIMASDSAARKSFIANVIAFCKEKDFDGIDLDWERMNNETKKKNYTKIMKELRIAVNKVGLQLVATVSFGNYWCQWIENEALQQADWIQVMAYDQTGTWSGSAFGNHASFEHFLQAETYWVKRGFSRNKMVMGLPFYGYKFKDKNGGQAKALRYSEIVAAFPNIDADSDQTPKEHYCFFNGPEIIKKKTNYALENGFAGVMVWEMSQDSKGDKSLHQVILNTFTTFCNRK